MESIFHKKLEFDNFGIMIDCSRNAVINVNEVKRTIDLMEKLGYNSLMLYTEDTYEIKEQPYFGHLRGRYSKEELKELDAYAAAHSVKLVPCIQTLAHVNALMYWGEYWAMADCNDILCVGDERVYKLIDDMFKTLSECFTSRLVNIGMDEAFMLGRGKYLDKNGYKEKLSIFIQHLNRVSEIAKKYGFEMLMWSDMFFRAALGSYSDSDTDSEKQIEMDLSFSKKIPDNVRLMYWDYTSTDEKHYDKWITLHEKMCKGTVFAGGLWSWLGFTPHNQYAIDTTIPAIKSCIKQGVKDFYLTIWGSETPKAAMLPSMFYGACLAHDISDEKIIKQMFEDEFKIAFDDFMLVDLPDTPNGDKGCPNPEKYMFYSDCLMGKFDYIVREGDGAKYSAVAEKLKPLTTHSQYGYMFEFLKNLCNVLSLKYELGVTTRKAYISGNKNELLTITADYDRLVELLESFYESFRRMWFIENKPHGIDCQDARIGGLILRVKNCKRRIEEYLNGEIDNIVELEEPVLDPLCRRGELTDEQKHSIQFNTWAASITANNIIT